MSDQPILDLKDVVAGYGSMTILNGTTFAVPKGAITTVIGPNGAGKSTVFKTIFGMLKARQGTVTLNGVNVTNWSPRKLINAGICYVPQGRNIFPELSVRHNIELGAVCAGPLRAASIDHSVTSPSTATIPTPAAMPSPSPRLRWVTVGSTLRVARSMICAPCPARGSCAWSGAVCSRTAVFTVLVGLRMAVTSSRVKR